MHTLHYFGESLANVTGDMNIVASGVFFDENQYRTFGTEDSQKFGTRHVSNQLQNIRSVQRRTRILVVYLQEEVVC